MATSATPVSSPEPVFEALNAFQQTAALKAAIELDLFTGIGEGKDTAEMLASHCRAAVRGVRILCDYLAVRGFLTKSDGRYALAPVSAQFLDRRSPACMASTARFLASSDTIDVYKGLAEAVRNGGAVYKKEGALAPEDPVWVEFAQSMASLMTLPAELIAQMAGADQGRTSKVLDIAAGHGLFGIAIARHNPDAEVVAVDWPNVLAVARDNAERAGVARRYRTIPGSAFDVNFGSGYDLALLTNFLHHFDPPTIEKFLRKVHASLADGGRAVALEMVPNDDRISPPVPAAFSLIMLGTTPAGDAYTYREYERMFGNAGFTACEIRPLPPTFESVVIAKK